MEECRICFEEDYIENFITPCLCRGTNKYVHEQCLQNWRIMAENPNNVTTCPSCKFKYIIEKQNKGLCQCFKKYSKNIGKNIKNIFITNIIYMIIISLILFILNNYKIVISKGAEVDNLLDISNYDLYIFHVANLIILIMYHLFFLFDIFTTFNKNQIIIILKKMYFISYIFCSFTLIYISFISIIPGVLATTFYIHFLSRDYIYLLDSNEILKDYKIISITDEEIQLDNLNNII